MNNEMWRLARQPKHGLPVIEDFVWDEQPLPDPGPGQALMRTIYLSLDPYQWVRRRSGVEVPGSVCHGRTVSQVIKSRHDDMHEGDYWFNTNGWQRYGLTGAGIDVFGYMHPRRLQPDTAPLSTAVGVLGMLGLTAYAGLIVQCNPQPGETVVVSAAAGGVGQVVGQLAKLRGCRVIGIAGAKEKCTFVCESLGFDACISHREPNLAEALQQACPDGCDVYFENVGGQVFDAVLTVLNASARISVCGLISQYGKDLAQMRESWLAAGQATFARQSIAVHDLFVGNFVDEYQAPFLEEVGAYVRAGDIQYREDRWDGLERAPDALRAMLEGGNFGKTLVVTGPEAL